jgi:hypothetical protein
MSLSKCSFGPLLARAVFDAAGRPLGVRLSVIRLGQVERLVKRQALVAVEASGSQRTFAIGNRKHIARQQMRLGAQELIWLGAKHEIEG